VEGPAENTVGGGAEGDWEVGEPVEDPGRPKGAGGRYWTPSPPRMWEGECRPRRRTP